jgi:hypothetical protein
MYDKRISRKGLTEDKKNEYMSRLSFIVDVKTAVKDAILSLRQYRKSWT